eukprot:CAMPEP_0118658584 /NCGR_PEP_ID=MMETSP0785-20121206/14650_1 /TAXON_ID=91992 /ORGANISM="Bolidomonas pacifica, Strain CCMP 1866" /LENGTH=42 /DNA_ID= /DNA_START= /DNA_END= /DNA_ORIENTATION=
MLQEEVDDARAPTQYSSHERRLTRFTILEIDVEAFVLSQGLG